MWEGSKLGGADARDGYGLLLRMGITYVDGMGARWLMTMMMDVVEVELEMFAWY